MKWINVKDKTPEIIKDNCSNIVLCMTSKFGSRESWCYELLYYNEHGKWQNMSDKDFENNPDYWFVIYWMKLPNPPKY